MPAIFETAYPRLSSSLSADEIKRLYRPTRKDKSWIHQRRIGNTLMLETLVFLKCFQRLGYFPRPSDIPQKIIVTVAQSIDLKEPTGPLKITQRSSNRIKHSIREYCGVKTFDINQDGEWLLNFAYDIATVKESTVDVINAMLEILIKESFELPAFSTLERLAHKARASALDHLFTNIASDLTLSARRKLDSLLTLKSDEGLTLWNELKKEPAKPTAKTIATYIRHTQWLKSLREEIGSIRDIPELKRYQCIAEARAYTADRMRELRRPKRMSLMAILIHEQHLFANDCLMDMLIRELRKTHNTAKKALIEFQLRVSSESVALVSLLRDIAQICTAKSRNRSGMDSILTLLHHEPQMVVDRCDKIVTHGVDNYLQFLALRYTKPLRKNLLDILSVAPVKDIAGDTALLACLKFILANRQESFASIRVSAIEHDVEAGAGACLNWVSERWHKLLFVETSPRIANRLLRPALFELCVLTEVSKRLQSGDLFIDNSVKYDDYRNHLVSNEVLRANLDQFCIESDLPRSGSEFSMAMKEALVNRAASTDQRFDNDEYVVIENGKLSLKRRLIYWWKRLSGYRYKDISVRFRVTKANYQTQISGWSQACFAMAVTWVRLKRLGVSRD